MKSNITMRCPLKVVRVHQRTIIQFATSTLYHGWRVEQKVKNATQSGLKCVLHLDHFIFLTQQIQAFFNLMMEETKEFSLRSNLHLAT